MVFHDGNGVALVNSTTVAITAAFYAVIALGVASVLHDAYYRKLEAEEREEETMLAYFCFIFSTATAARIMLPINRTLKIRCKIST